MIISLSIWLVATFPQAAPQAHTKPAVLLVSQNPTDLDHWIVERQNAEDVRKMVEKKKLITKEFKEFTFYYSPKSLGIEDAKNEAKLMDEISEQLKGRSRSLDTSKLSEATRDTLRGILSCTPGDDEFHTVADSPNLKLSAGIDSEIGIHYGTSSTSYNLRSVPPVKNWNSIMNPKPTTDDISKWKGRVAKYPNNDKKLAATPFLAFVYSSSLDSIHKLTYLEQTQIYLREQCVEAKLLFDEASKKAMSSIYGDFAKRYDKLNSLDRLPKFSDLGPYDQEDVKRMFTMLHQAGGTDPNVFLNYGSTDSFNTYFSLTLMYPVELGQPAAHTVTIPFQCPIGQ